MKIIWPIVLTFLISVGSLIAVNAGVSLMWIGVVLSILIPFIFSSNYKSFQNSILDTAKEDEGVRVYYNVFIIGGSSVINRSGMGIQYDSNNPIEFITVSDKGIDGVMTMKWSEIISAEHNEGQKVVLNITKLIRFMYTKKVEIIFNSIDDAQDFTARVDNYLLT